MARITPTVSHWGAGFATTENGRLVDIAAAPADPAPSPILRNALGAIQSDARVKRPAIREGYLKAGAASDPNGRGAEPFVEAPWDEALDIAADALRRVRAEHGGEAIFSGSYGWASAGRFHHAQSQLKRFMNCAGGFTRHVDNYSFAAALVITPHVVGSLRDMMEQATVWPVVRDHSELVVMFGGMPVGNAQIAQGGISQHKIAPLVEECRRAGVSFVSITPARPDAPEALDARWLAPRPNTDTALMLGLAHTLIVEGLHDQTFLDRCAVGFDQLRAYILGETDGTAKTADWAAAITEIDAETIRGLAREMAAKRTFITIAASLQRADRGEQPFWMAIALAAMLGQVGLPGGGFGLCYGCNGTVGAPVLDFPWPALPQGPNPIDRFIPVARIADMLLTPGARFEYNGRAYAYPDIKLVYWAGGNPFHHHQDVNRLIAAFRRPETVIVNEIFWTGAARHADIVFPITSTLERDDIAMTRYDQAIVAMKRAIDPVGEARDDFDVFAGLARRLGLEEAFTEGRDADGWLRALWRDVQTIGAARNVDIPSFDAFWEAGVVDLPAPPENQVLLAAFRDDPAAHPLSTPSGRIELFSETVAGFGYADCPGHPTWFEPEEWLGAPAATRFPLHLLSGQPTTRLHSQLDNGETSLAGKVAGREPALLHPDDAAARGIADGDVIRLFNDRGACLAGARLSPSIRRGVVQLKTGAWYDPETPGEIGALDKHGNPNLVTGDRGTSQLAQGPSAHSALVEVERVDDAPPVTAHQPPRFAPRT